MKRISQIIDARPASDGDGVKIQRIAGRSVLAVLDPYLMIDEINSDDAADYIGGFPEHPHRGFETITYMKAGRMRHRDHMGNEGVIGAGDLQWMTAGAGVLHSEMPEQEAGLLHGFQIWLNLPAGEKMKPAAYRDILSADIPEQALPAGGRVRVLAGEVNINELRLAGAAPALSTAPVLLDVRLTPGESLELEVDDSKSILVYIYDGSTETLGLRQLAVYDGEGPVQLQAGEHGAQFLVLGGRPIREPIVQYGPFVMNSAQQIEQALDDYRRNVLVAQPASV